MGDYLLPPPTTLQFDWDGPAQDTFIPNETIQVNPLLKPLVSIRIPKQKASVVRTSGAMISITDYFLLRHVQARFAPIDAVDQ